MAFPGRGRGRGRRSNNRGGQARNNGGNNGGNTGGNNGRAPKDTPRFPKDPNEVLKAEQRAKRFAVPSQGGAQSQSIHAPARSPPQDAPRGPAQSQSNEALKAQARAKRFTVPPQDPAQSQSDNERIRRLVQRPPEPASAQSDNARIRQLLQRPSEPKSAPAASNPIDTSHIDPSNYQARFEHIKRNRPKALRDAVAQGKMLDPEKQHDLKTAIPMVGTCQDMCPEFERVRRVVQGDVSSPECVPGSNHWKPDESRMVKKFRRPAAGIEPQLPSDLRPPGVLLKTTKYLTETLLSEAARFEYGHPYIWDRTRAVRNDFTIQDVHHLADLALAIEAHERIVAFHLISLHLLSDPKHKYDGFSRQQEMQQLGSALTSLLQYYEKAYRQDQRVLSEPRLPLPREADFRAIALILEAQSGKSSLDGKISTWPDAICKSPRMRRAIKIFNAAIPFTDRQDQRGPTSPGDWAAFWKLVGSKETSFLMACAAETTFYRVRRSALQSILKTYCHRTSAVLQGWTEADLTKALAFDTNDQTVAFCKAHDIECFYEDEEWTLDLSKLNKKQLSEPKDLPECRSKKLVASKLSGRNLSAAIGGISVLSAKSMEGMYANTDSVNYHKYDSLFVSSGKRTSGQNNVAADQTNRVPDHKEFTAGRDFTTSNGMDTRMDEAANGEGGHTAAPATQPTTAPFTSVSFANPMAAPAQSPTNAPSPFSAPATINPSSQPLTAPFPSASFTNPRTAPAQSPTTAPSPFSAPATTDQFSRPPTASSTVTPSASSIAAPPRSPTTVPSPFSAPMTNGPFSRPPTAPSTVTPSSASSMAAPAQSPTIAPSPFSAPQITTPFSKPTTALSAVTATSTIPMAAVPAVTTQPWNPIPIDWSKVTSFQKPSHFSTVQQQPDKEPEGAQDNHAPIPSDAAVAGVGGPVKSAYTEEPEPPGTVKAADPLISHTEIDWDPSEETNTASIEPPIFKPLYTMGSHSFMGSDPISPSSSISSSQSHGKASASTIASGSFTPSSSTSSSGLPASAPVPSQDLSILPPVEAAYSEPEITQEDTKYMQSLSEQLTLEPNRGIMEQFKEQMIIDTVKEVFQEHANSVEEEKKAWEEEWKATMAAGRESRQRRKALNDARKAVAAADAARKARSEQYDEMMADMNRAMQNEAEKWQKKADAEEREKAKSRPPFATVTTNHTSRKRPAQGEHPDSPPDKRHSLKAPSESAEWLPAEKLAEKVDTPQSTNSKRKRSPDDVGIREYVGFPAEKSAKKVEAPKLANSKRKRSPQEDHPESSRMRTPLNSQPSPPSKNRHSADGAILRKSGWLSGDSLVARGLIKPGTLVCNAKSSYWRLKAAGVDPRSFDEGFDNAFDLGYDLGRKRGYEEALSGSSPDDEYSPPNKKRISPRSRRSVTGPLSAQDEALFARVGRIMGELKEGGSWYREEMNAGERMKSGGEPRRSGGSSGQRMRASANRRSGSSDRPAYWARESKFVKKVDKGKGRAVEQEPEKEPELVKGGTSVEDAIEL